MELVEVEIVAQVITARYGTLSTGDILKTDQAYADHLVNDCKGARWTEPQAVPAVPEEAGQALAAPPGEVAQTVEAAPREEDPKLSAKVAKKAAK